jgi:hypothetical protein
MHFIVLLYQSSCVGALVPTYGYLGSTLMAREPDDPSFITVQRSFEGS